MTHAQTRQRSDIWLLSLLLSLINCKLKFEASVYAVNEFGHTVAFGYRKPCYILPLRAVAVTVSTCILLRCSIEFNYSILIFGFSSMCLCLWRQKASHYSPRSFGKLYISALTLISMFMHASTFYIKNPFRGFSHNQQSAIFRHFANEHGTHRRNSYVCLSHERNLVTLRAKPEIIDDDLMREKNKGIGISCNLPFALRGSSNSWKKCES